MPLDDLMISKPHEVVEREIANGAGKGEACLKAGISVGDYEALLIDPLMLERYKRALALQTEFYERLARKRVVDGDEEITYGADGNIIKRVVKKDGALLSKMLAARDERYRSTSKGDVTLNFDFGGMLNKAQERVKKLRVIDVEPG